MQGTQKSQAKESRNDPEPGLTEESRNAKAVKNTRSPAAGTNRVYFRDYMITALQEPASFLLIPKQLSALPLSLSQNAYGYPNFFTLC